MFDFNITNKVICIFGLRGSGKTNFAKWLIKNSTKPVLIYDWHAEHAKMDRKDCFYYVPQFKDEPERRVIELNEVIKTYVLATKRIKMVVIDEANQYCPPKPTPLPYTIRDLNDNGRHYGQTAVYIARRPTQLHSDLIELADFRVFFNLTGKNDLQYLDSLKAGLGDIVQKLGRHEFAILDNFGVVSVQKPVNFSDHTPVKAEVAGE